jgi:hypothetical protein
LTEQVERSREKEEDRQLSVKVSVMQPILRFLQLLCENHNKQLQNLLRWGIFEPEPEREPEMLVSDPH